MLNFTELHQKEVHASSLAQYCLQDIEQRLDTYLSLEN